MTVQKLGKTYVYLVVIILVIKNYFFFFMAAIAPIPANAKPTKAVLDTAASVCG